MKTQAQLDRAADQRLRKVYGISLAEYGQLLEAGGGGCWVCSTKPTGRRLHVDHDHGWKKIPLVVEKVGKGWKASAEYNERVYWDYAEKQSVSKKLLRVQLKRASVRGLLCYPHNAGLQKFQDNRQWLRAASIYILAFEGGMSESQKVLNQVLNPEVA